MSEDWYFADDEETPAEVDVQEHLRPTTVSSPTQQSDIDDIFEGEPDSSLFASSSLDNAGSILARTAGNEAGAGHGYGDPKQQFMHEQPQTLITASGGLGHGDVPYDMNASLKMSDDLRHQNEQYDHQKSEWWSHYLHGPNASRQREERLKELSGETFGKYGHENDVYSPSASSESVSVIEDEHHAKPGSEEVKQSDATTTLPFPNHNVQTEPFKAAHLVQEDNAHSKPQSNDQDESTSAGSNTGSTHPSLLDSLTHLSEVTPADVQGHHPSVIPRSPRKVMSRASSLASEGGPDIVEEPQPLTEAALREKDILTMVEGPKSFRSPFSPIKVEPLLSRVTDNTSLSPFRQPDAKRSTSSSRSSPLRRPADFTDAVGTFAVTDSPMPLLYAVPSRPDTPRPPTELENLGAVDRSHAQSVSPATSTTNSEPHQALHAGVPAPLLPGPVLTSSFRYGASAQESSYTATEIIPQLASEAVKATIPPSISPLESQTISGNLPRLEVPWQETRIVPDAESHPDQAQSKDSSMASLHSKAGISSEISARESTGIDRRPSDPFSTGKDLIRFAASLAESFTLSSPLTGLHDAIQVKRGSRKATTPKRKATRNLTSTRGRAVSASPKKCRTSTTTSNASATGVQGEGIKITKTIPKKATRVTSRKATTPKYKTQSINDDVPKVPDVPQDMLVDVPDLYPRPVRIQKSEQRCRMPTTPTARSSSSAQSTPSKAATRVKERNDKLDNLPKTLVKDQATSPKVHEQQLKVPKTRKNVKSSTIVSSTKTPPNQNKTYSPTPTAQTPEHSRMEIDTISPVHRPDPLQHETQIPNRQNKPRTPSTKKRPATRKPTPGGIQKSTVRKPRTPARLPTHKPNQITDLLERDGHVEQPAKSTQTPQIKTKTAPRKATPILRKRKQDNKALNDAVPPVPMTPKQTNKNGTVEANARLTPQSAEGAQPKTPLRRSPRLSGVEPGQGL